jgi:PAS domain S-box-containing protein
LNDSVSSPSFPSPADPAGLAAVFLLDASGRVTAVSDAARALWQVEAGGLLEESFPDLFVCEVATGDDDWRQALWQAVLDSTLDRTATLTARPRRDVPGDVRVRLEKFPGGGYLATVQPPPPPVALPATAGLAASFQLLAAQSAVGFFELDLKSGRALYSPHWKKMLGYTDAEFPDTIEAWRELIHPDDSAAAPDRAGRPAATGARSFSAEFRLRHRLGRWIWIECLGVQVPGPGGEIERFAGLQIDISERKELEEAGLANEERLERLTGSGQLGVFDLDFSSRVFWFSPAWKKILGYRDDEFPHELASFTAALPPDEAGIGAEAWLLVRAPGQASFIESTRLIGKDQRPVSVLLGAHRTFTRKRDLARVIGFICAAPPPSAGAGAPGEALPSVLVTESFAALGEGIVLTNPQGRILHVNPVAARLLSIPAQQAVGAPVGDVLRLVNRLSGRPVDDPCDQALSANQPLPLIRDDALASADDGAAPQPVVWTARAAFDSTGRPLGVAIVFRNPDEMNLTPEELVKANRFESLGLLAGGIAHDFNNLLTTILGGISLAKTNADFSGLDDSETACLTAKGLTQQLFLFAKGGTGPQVVVDARELLDQATKIAAAGSDAEIEVIVPDGVAPVRVDRVQILQVFQNLVVNALQAMPPAPHRARVQLGAVNTTLAAEQIPPLPAGDYVEFEVRDNGAGISAENLEKIFDPFFTTKKHGTGLGLATVLSMVRKHGGQIGVGSTPGEGTVFTVFLPQAGKPPDVQARPAPSLRFGTGRILFMDDDPKIAALTGTMLQSLDYRFDIAKNGDEAIALYQRYLNIGRPYDAVIMDLTVIGGMGGEECFRALRALDPDVRAIVASGYDSDDLAHRFLELGFCGYLTKPYRVSDLGKVIKAVVG